MSQVLQDTIAARDLLATGGWLPGLLRDRETGQHCAAGAVLDTVMADGVWHSGKPATGFNCFTDLRMDRVLAVVDELAKSIPGDWDGGWFCFDSWSRVVTYNNTQGEQVVMDMFNATIARLTQIEAQQPVRV
jgi:hypothetical protein